MENVYSGKCKYAPIARPEVKEVFYRRRQKERSDALYWRITIACFIWVIAEAWSLREHWKHLAIFAGVVLLMFLVLDHVPFQAF